MTAAYLQTMKPAAFFVFRGSRVVSEFDPEGQGNGILRLSPRRRCFGISDAGGKKRMCNVNRVCCKLQDGDNIPSNNNNSEPPESLFVKELRNRGISPTSPLEEISKSTIEEEMIEEEGDRSSSKRNLTATNLTNQREQSMALNSEGLEGLIPRGKLLLRLGGTLFLAFWPLILLTIASFAALSLYFGPSFVHDGREMPITSPQYIDPYALLHDERIMR